jgi:hypothetical protein
MSLSEALGSGWRNARRGRRWAPRADAVHGGGAIGPSVARTGGEHARNAGTRRRSGETAAPGAICGRNNDQGVDGK